MRCRPPVRAAALTTLLLLNACGRTPIDFELTAEPSGMELVARCWQAERDSETFKSFVAELPDGAPDASCAELKEEVRLRDPLRGTMVVRYLDDASGDEILRLVIELDLALVPSSDVNAYVLRGAKLRFLGTLPPRSRLTGTASVEVRPQADKSLRSELTLALECSQDPSLGQFLATFTPTEVRARWTERLSLTASSAGALSMQTSRALAEGTAPGEHCLTFARPVRVAVELDPTLTRIRDGFDYDAGKDDWKRVLTRLDDHARAYRAAPAATSAAAALVPYRDKDKWGFADGALRVVIPPTYDRVSRFVGDARAAVWRGGKCGFVDPSGYEVVLPELDNCTDYHEGVAGVMWQPRGAPASWLLVDTNGRPLVRRRFAAIFSYVSSDGLIGAKDENGRIGFIARDGRVRVDFAYEDHIRPSGGVIAVVRGDRWGAIDYDGNELLPFIYDALHPFSGGLAFAKKSEKWGVIDKHGKAVVPFEFEFIHDSAAAEAFVAQRVFDQPPSLVFDHAGTLIASVPFNADSSVHEGLFVVSRGDKSGFADMHGNITIPLEYDAACHFSQGLAWVAKAGRYGLIDHDNRIVVPLRYGSRYDAAWLDPSGILDVLDASTGVGRGLTFFIDRRGREYMSEGTRAWFKSHAPRPDARP